MVQRIEVTFLSKVFTFQVSSSKGSLKLVIQKKSSPSSYPYAQRRESFKKSHKALKRLLVQGTNALPKFSLYDQIQGIKFLFQHRKRQKSSEKRRDRERGKLVGSGLATGNNRLRGFESSPTTSRNLPLSLSLPQRRERRNDRGRKWQTSALWRSKGGGFSRG